MHQLSEKKLYKPFSNDIDQPIIFSYLKKILAKDSYFIKIAAIYGVVISLLSLAIPLSVQLLINSVSYTAMMQPVFFLGITLFLFLGFWAFLNATRFYVTEIFQRKFFSRMAAEVGLSLLDAEYKTFEESNQTEMVNRFFEAINIQKTIPKLLTKTFAVILQAVAGLLLVTFYHPIFLVFSLLIILCVWMIWSSYYKESLKSSFYESRRKYDIAGWLEDIARGHSIFKSQNGHDYAKFKIDFLTGLYLKDRKTHFRNLFSQVLLLLALYVVASVLLLVIGGWLILKGQLTVGQLVAAELVLSVSLYGISQLGKDFEGFYDLVASCEKLSQFQNIPSDKKGGDPVPENDWHISFKDVSYKNRQHSYLFNFDIHDGQNYAIFSEGFSIRSLVIDMIHGFTEPHHGIIELNGKNLIDYDLYEYRAKIGVIDDSPLIEGTVGEYLSLGSKGISKPEIVDVLKILDLEKVILRDNEEGLNLRVIPSGWPFSETEKLLLKTARILLLKPEIIIITEIFDILAPEVRAKLLRYLAKDHSSSVLYFTSRNESLEHFDSYLLIERTQSLFFNSSEEIVKFQRSSHDE
jgi:putative ABC transport system ATP-binding protein